MLACTRDVKRSHNTLRTKIINLMMNLVTIHINTWRLTVKFRVSHQINEEQVVLENREDENIEPRLPIACLKICSNAKSPKANTDGL